MVVQQNQVVLGHSIINHGNGCRVNAQLPIGFDRHAQRLGYQNPYWADMCNDHNGLARMAHNDVPHSRNNPPSHLIDRLSALRPECCLILLPELVFQRKVTLYFGKIEPFPDTKVALAQALIIFNHQVWMDPIYRRRRHPGAQTRTGTKRIDTNLPYQLCGLSRLSNTSNIQRRVILLITVNPVQGKICFSMTKKNQPGTALLFPHATALHLQA